MCLSSVLLPEPLPPMITNTSPRRTVKLRSCISTKLPYAIVRSRTVMRASGANFGAGDSLPPFPFGALFDATATSDSENVEHDGEDSTRSDDRDDARHHRGRRRLADRGGAVPRLHAAKAPRDRDQDAVNGRLEDATNEVAQRNGGRRLLVVRH